MDEPSRLRSRVPRLLRLFFPVPVLIALLAFYVSHPQPELDLQSVRSLAAAHVGAPPPTGSDSLPLDGVAVVITGATSGIGHGLAVRLWEMGATIGAVGRSKKKLDGLREELPDGGRGAEKGGRIETFVADLSDLNAVSRAADEIVEAFGGRVDFLINNAGLAYLTPDFAHAQNISTAQGYDMVFGVNYLSHFLLTQKLLPALEKSNLSPRIIQVSSSFHFLTDGADLRPEKGGPPLSARDDVNTFFHRLRAYPSSKLAQILHARYLTRELQKVGSNVIVLSICPGWVGTHVGGEVNRHTLERVAFPADGFGLSTILEAMFRPGVGRPDMNFVMNNLMLKFISTSMNNLGLTRPWASVTGARDLATWAAAVICLYPQKFFGAVQWTESSPESYDEEIQESLYKWSNGAVSEWL